MDSIEDELAVATVQIFEELLNVASCPTWPTGGHRRLVIVSSYFGTWEAALHRSIGLRHLQLVNTLALLVDERAGEVHRGLPLVRTLEGQDF